MKIVKINNESNNHTPIIISDANYIGDFAIRIRFKDGTERLVDFKSFLKQSHHPAIKKYLDENNFKQFNIIDGNLNWNDYDLIFPVSDLYEGYIN
jgi:hypothetical protein